MTSTPAALKKTYFAKAAPTGKNPWTPSRPCTSVLLNSCSPCACSNRTEVNHIELQSKEETQALWPLPKTFSISVSRTNFLLIARFAPKSIFNLPKSGASGETNLSSEHIMKLYLETDWNLNRKYSSHQSALSLAGAGMLLPEKQKPHQPGRKSAKRDECPNFGWSSGSQHLQGEESMFENQWFHQYDPFFTKIMAWEKRPPGKILEKTAVLC